MDKKFINDLYEIFETEEDRRRRNYMKGIKASLLASIFASMISVLASTFSVPDIVFVMALFLPIIPIIMLFVFGILYIRVY